MTKLEGILRLPVRLVYSCKSVLQCEPTWMILGERYLSNANNTLE